MPHLGILCPSTLGLRAVHFGALACQESSWLDKKYKNVSSSSFDMSVSVWPPSVVLGTWIKWLRNFLSAAHTWLQDFLKVACLLIARSSGPHCCYLDSCAWKHYRIIYIELHSCTFRIRMIQWLTKSNNECQCQLFWVIQLVRWTDKSNPVERYCQVALQCMTPLRPERHCWSKTKPASTGFTWFVRSMVVVPYKRQIRSFLFSFTI